MKIGEGETVVDTFDYDTFRNYLNELGDSLLVVADDEIIKVHVHTERQGSHELRTTLRFINESESGQHALATRKVLKTDYTAKVKEAAQNKKRNTESWQLLQVRDSRIIQEHGCNDNHQRWSNNELKYRDI